MYGLGTWVTLWSQDTSSNLLFEYRGSGVAQPEVE